MGLTNIRETTRGITDIKKYQNNYFMNYYQDP